MNQTFAVGSRVTVSSTSSPWNGYTGEVLSVERDGDLKVRFTDRGQTHDRFVSAASVTPARSEYHASATCPICRACVIVRRTRGLRASLLRSLALADHVRTLHSERLPRLVVSSRTAREDRRTYEVAR